MISALARDLRAVFAVPVLLIFPLTTMAAEPPASAALASPLAGALQMLFGLGIVLVAIACTVWLARRLAPGQAGAASDLRIVAAVAVGPKERVVLVDVGSRRLVLGVAPGQVSKLMEMPRPETDDATSATVPPFVGKLKEMLAKRREAQ